MTSSQNSKEKPNLYLVLDLMPGVSHNDILHAYNRAKNTYTGGSLAGYSLLDGDSAQSILEDIEKAYSVLGNPSKRREYDIEMGFQTWTDESDKAPVKNVLPKKETSKPSSGPVVRSRGSTIFESNSEPDNMGLSLTGFDAPVAKVEATEKSPRTIIPMKAPQSPAPETATPTQERKFEPNLEFEEKVKTCTSIDGAFLRALRVYRGYSVEALAHRTKLSASHVQTVENEGPESDLPAPVYLRGHVFLICQTLGLPDPNKLASGYIDKLKAQGRIKSKNF